MSKGNTFENDLLKLIFQAIAIANLADNAASSPLTNLYWAAHTADPGEAGDQTTNEITTVAYVNYARVATPRTSGGFLVVTNTAKPLAHVDFPTAGVGATGTITHWSLGIAASGAGKILYSGTVTPNILLAESVIARYSNASTITED